MQKLHLVGITPDLDGLILSTRKGAKSGSFVVKVDAEVLQRLFDAHKAQVPAPAQKSNGAARSSSGPRTTRPNSNLSPREMQELMRNGWTIEEIAEEAGVDVDWVSRFAAPVRAEMRLILDQARECVFDKGRLGLSALPLAQSVRRNVSDRGVRFTDDEFDEGWRAFQLEGGVWMIEFRFRGRGKQQIAEWSYDADEATLTATNRLAGILGHVPSKRKRAATDGGTSGGKKPAKRATKKKAATTKKKAGTKKVAAKKVGTKKVATKTTAATKKAAVRRSTPALTTRMVTAQVRPRSLPQHVEPTAAPPTTAAPAAARDPWREELRRREAARPAARATASPTPAPARPAPRPAPEPEPVVAVVGPSVRMFTRTAPKPSPRREPPARTVPQQAPEDAPDDDDLPDLTWGLAPEKKGPLPAPAPVPVPEEIREKVAEPLGTFAIEDDRKDDDDVVEVAVVVEEPAPTPLPAAAEDEPELPAATWFPPARPAPKPQRPVFKGATAAAAPRPRRREPLRGR